MKKFIILASIISIAGTACAIPNVDVSAGGMPFRMIQEAMYEEQEMDDMQSRKEDMKFLERIKKPSRFNLKQQNPTEFQRPTQQPEMQMIQEDGKIKIKPVN